jgi:hypothetical protein
VRRKRDAEPPAGLGRSKARSEAKLSSLPVARSVMRSRWLAWPRQGTQRSEAEQRAGRTEGDAEPAASLRLTRSGTRQV